MNRLLIAVAFLSGSLQAQSLETVKVVEGPASRVSKLPAELRPFLKTTIRARVNGFVETMDADVGTQVRAGQRLARVSAPEIPAQIAAAESKVTEITTRRAEIEARIAGARSTLARLREASKTPGVIAANELVVSENEINALEASAASIDAAAAAAKTAVQPLRDLLAYLEITAPFDGVITQRLAHPGTLVGPGAADTPLYELEQVSQLRLIIAMPEAAVPTIAVGARVGFRVPAHSEREFTGTVARIPRVLDPKTRSMFVEADVANANGALAPGMYAEVNWTSRAARRPMLVPPSAIAVTTSRTFVIRVHSGKAEWVDVMKGNAVGDLVEVAGPIAIGDEIIRRASDEIRQGSPVK
ncbi:MAG: efflux RND transporter periplasmic adaptor subunit [Acidobacteriota bacterium]